MGQLFLLEIVGYFLLLKFGIKKDRLYIAPAIIYGAIALAGAIAKGVKAHKQNKLARQINPNDPTYTPSPYAADNLGLAQSLYNGRMAGAADLQRNIEGSQGTAIGAINKNATNSSQALSLSQLAQGQTNESLGNLAIQESQDRNNRANAVYSANQGMVEEGNKQYNDMVRKYGSDVAAKSQLSQAASNNNAGMWSDLTSAAIAGTSAMGSNGQAGGSSYPTGNYKFRSPNSRMTTGMPNYYNAADTGNIMMPQQPTNWQTHDPYPGAWNPARRGQFNYLTGKWMY